MRVTIRLFANLRDLAGGEIEERFDGDSVTVAELCRQLEQSHPALGPHLPGVAVAVNDEYVLDDRTPLRDDDEVALIPPVSGGGGAGGSDDGDGGSGGATPRFLVTTEVLDAHALRDLVRTDRSGAVVLFEGVVRDRHDGHDVLRLEYQAHESMAQRQLEAVARAVLDELPVHDIAVHHRIGTLEVGETSLLVAVSGEHRAEAFRAALRVVDRVKESVPVWKKEYTPDGATWQEGRPARPVG